MPANTMKQSPLIGTAMYHLMIGAANKIPNIRAKKVWVLLSRFAHDNHFGRLQSPSLNALMHILRRYPIEANPSMVEKNNMTMYMIMNNTPSVDVSGGVEVKTKLMQSQNTPLEPKPKATNMMSERIIEHALYCERLTYPKGTQW